ncbi:MAG TPA: glycosyltransferase family 2 protein [Thermoanaerobaculia bacterium]
MVVEAERRRSGLRERLRRLLRRPPSDWAGPDPATEAVRRAPPPEAENRHEVVCLGQSADELDPRLASLAAAGHRVFLARAGSDADSGPAAEVAPYSLRERAPRLFEIPLRNAGEGFESLDRLRRDQALGATVAVVKEREWLPLAERLRAERAWRVLDLSGDVRSLGEAALATALADAFPKISIIVVTYNNRELNRACLESVFARTEWPRYEVLAVDNGSTDGTPELLAELARAHANLRVIALPENRGFPAACNAGLAEAAGDPLVLLNNDTLVTRGWLTSLHRHLAVDPGLGLVGPVTNAIANEARIEVGYGDPAALPRWASAWVRRHDGETFPIPMLAFFCVALRREAFAAIGPLDERFGLGLFEDGDYCRRLRAKGWDIRCARDAFVHHWQNASFRRLGRDAYFALYEENRRKYEAKWGSMTANSKETPAP